MSSLTDLKIPCDRCPAYARHFYADLEEVTPTLAAPAEISPSGDYQVAMYRQWRVRRAYRRCDDHARPGQRFFRDGTVEVISGGT